MPRRAPAPAPRWRSSRTSAWPAAWRSPAARSGPDPATPGEERSGRPRSTVAIALAWTSAPGICRRWRSGECPAASAPRDRRPRSCHGRSHAARGRDRRSRTTPGEKCFPARSSRSRRSLHRTRSHDPPPLGDFGARHRERLQPADREADASQDAARIGRQQPVGRPRPDFAQQRVAFAAEEPHLPVAFGFGGGHHGAPFGVVQRFEQRRLIAGACGHSPGGGWAPLVESGKRWPR